MDRGVRFDQAYRVKQENQGRVKTLRMIPLSNAELLLAQARLIVL